jgi:hypothetical protein
MEMIADAPSCEKEIPLLCNAWNEWSEGAAIEPCYYLGNTLLAGYIKDAREYCR